MLLNKAPVKKDETKNMVNPDPFAPVRLSPVMNNGRRTDKLFVEMQTPDEEFMEIPGVAVVHGENYTLVPNQTVHEMGLSVIEKSGLKFEPMHTAQTGNILWNGRQYAERWFTPDMRVPSPTGSEVMLGMEVRNSYDGSSRVRVAFFAMHLVCHNQFYSQQLMGRPYTASHITQSGEFSEDAALSLEGLGDMATRFPRIAGVFNALNANHLEMGDFLKLRSGLKEEAGISLRDTQFLDELTGGGISGELSVPKEAYGVSDDGITLWSVVNAYSAMTTHKNPSISSSDRFERFFDYILKTVAA